MDFFAYFLEALLLGRLRIIHACLLRTVFGRGRLLVVVPRRRLIILARFVYND